MVEKWLQQVEQMMLASVREVISLGIADYVQVNENRGARARVSVQPHRLFAGSVSASVPTTSAFTKTRPDGAGWHPTLCASLLFCRS